MHSATECRAQNFFKPTREEFNEYLKIRGSFDQALLMLPNKETIKFMYLQFWHEFDCKVAGFYRMKVTGDNGKISWEQINQGSMTERLIESRKLESWQRLAEFGRSDPVLTGEYLLSLWIKPAAKLDRFELDLIPFVLLEIMNKTTILESLEKSETDAIKFATETNIQDLWSEYVKTRKNSLPRKVQ
jgi:hypothetical protein